MGRSKPMVATCPRGAPLARAPRSQASTPAISTPRRPPCPLRCCPHGISPHQSRRLCASATCTAPTPCARARSASRRSPNSPRPMRCRRWRSPTPTTSSARSNSRKSSPNPAFSRSSARRSRSISPTRPAGGASRLADQRFQRAPIVLLARNERGYLNLMRIASKVWLDPKDGDEPHVGFSALDDCEGLIALTGGPAGPLDRALGDGMDDVALTRLKRLERLFGDRLYIEVAAPRPRQRAQDRARADRPRLRPFDSAGGDQRTLFRRRQRFRGAGCAAVRRRGRAGLGARAPAAFARASLQDARGDARAVRGPRRRRPTTASRSRCAAPIGR